ncbi:hypothetical protein [Corallococcus sp. AB030]|uniref:hypothetical protein n=1 Tax=Corallococcus sp. AB030 TaxID=2316716 RepID=UPI0011E5B9FF|nr:hypothetical protein [Corallococcus sp. AB030]
MRSRLSLLVPLLLCACASGPSPRAEEPGEERLPPRSPMNPDAPSLKRGEALLRHGTGSDVVLPAEPVPIAQELGALAGFGQTWTSCSARASVYLFDSYGDATTADARLRKQVPEGKHGAVTVNGDWLIWATADATDEAGRDVIERVVSAFAGEE